MRRAAPPSFPGACGNPAVRTAARAIRIATIAIQGSLRADCAPSRSAAEPAFCTMMDMPVTTPPDIHNSSDDGSRLAQILGRLMPAVLERQGALLAVKDAATGRYEHVNSGMAMLFGMTAAE